MTDIKPEDVPKYESTDNSSSLLQLSDKTYDYLKAIVTIILPAASTFYVAVAGIWGLGNSEKVAGTMLAIITFLGVILRISTKKYNKSDAKFDGAIDITNNEEGSLLNVKLDPVAVADKDQILVKVNQPTSG